MNNTRPFNNHIIIDDEEVVSSIGNHNTTNGQVNTNFGGGGFQSPSNRNTNGESYRNYNQQDDVPWNTETNVSQSTALSDTTEFISGFYAVVGGTPIVIRKAYDTNIDGAVYDNLTNSIDPSKGLGNSNMVAIAGSILDYSPTDMSIIDLPNGISSNRIIFFLTFRRKNSYNGKVSLFYVNGYTDRVDMSFGGILDPETEFYVNEIVEIESGYNKDRNGNPVYYQQLKACDQIISGSFNVHDVSTADHSVRPFDLFQRAREGAVLSRHGRRIGNIVSDSFVFTQSNKYKKSSRINNNPYDYISRSIKAFDAAHADREVSTADDLYTNASERVLETGITNDHVISCFSRVCDIRRNGYFKLKDLHHVFPKSKDPTYFINASSKDIPSYIDSVDLTSRIYEVSIGSSLVNAISSVALKHYFTELTFDVIPLASHGIRSMNSPRYEMVITHARGYLPENYVKIKLGDFEREFLNLIMPSIIPDPDNVGIEFQFSFKIIDKCYINLRINGGQWYPQTYPSFCDSLRAPVIATGPETITRISSDILDTYEQLYGAFRFD